MAYSAAQVYPSVFCLYADANTRTCTRTHVGICLCVMFSHKFLYVKHCLWDKGMKTRQASKRNLDITLMKAIIFRFPSARKFSYQKWEENWNNSRLN